MQQSCSSVYVDVLTWDTYVCNSPVSSTGWSLVSEAVCCRFDTSNNCVDASWLYVTVNCRVPV